MSRLVAVAKFVVCVYIRKLSLKPYVSSGHRKFTHLDISILKKIQFSLCYAFVAKMPAWDNTNNMKTCCIIFIIMQNVCPNEKNSAEYLQIWFDKASTIEERLKLGFFSAAPDTGILGKAPCPSIFPTLRIMCGTCALTQIRTEGWN